MIIIKGTLYLSTCALAANVPSSGRRQFKKGLIIYEKTGNEYSHAWKGANESNFALSLLRLFKIGGLSARTLRFLNALQNICGH